MGPFKRLARLVWGAAFLAALALASVAGHAHAQSSAARAVLQPSPCAGVVLKTDFAGGGGQGLYCYRGQRFGSLLALPGASFTRASTETCTWSDGHLTYAASGVPCITDMGLAVWESRTNVLLQSQNAGATWATANLTVNAAASVAPDGSSTANLLTATAANTTTQWSQSVSKAASALPYTVSFFAKAKEANWIMLTVYDGTSVFDRQWFNLATGALGTHATGGGGFSGFSASCAPSANAFYRCVVSVTSSTTTSIQAFFYVTTADAVFTNPTIAAGAGLYWWGAELDQASFLAPYIPTTSAAATRAADVAKFTGLVAPPAYTISARTVRFVNNPGVSAQPFFSYAAADFHNSVSINYRNFASNFTTAVWSASVQGWSPSDAGAEAGLGIAQTAAIALGGGAGQNAANGAIITTLASVAPPITPSNLVLGANADGTGQMNGFIRRLSFIPRMLTQAELQALTQ